MQQRASIRIVIAEKFVETFSWYEADLDAIQTLYNKYKVIAMSIVLFNFKMSSFV